jgi:hypothetical protein
VVRHLLWEQGHAGSTPVTLTKLSNQPNQPMKKKTNKADKATNETKEYHLCVVVHYTTTVKANSLEEAEEMANTMDFSDMYDEVVETDVTEV